MEFSQTVLEIINGDSVQFNYDNTTGIAKITKYALTNGSYLMLFETEEMALNALENFEFYQGYSLYNLPLPEPELEEILNYVRFGSYEEAFEFINGGYKNTSLYTLTGKVNTDVMTLDEYKDYKQEMNKKELSNYLENNPLLWTDGKYYGVTQEDQIEMQTDLAAYNLKQQAGDTSWKLEWHDKQKACREFTLEEFYSLMDAIIDFVYPLRRMQEDFKEEIYACTTREELDNLVISYSSLNSSMEETIENSSENSSDKTITE